MAQLMLLFERGITISILRHLCSDCYISEYLPLYEVLKTSKYKTDTEASNQWKWS